MSVWWSWLVSLSCSWWKLLLLRSLLLRVMLFMLRLRLKLCLLKCLFGCNGWLVFVKFGEVWVLKCGLSCVSWCVFVKCRCWKWFCFCWVRFILCVRILSCVCWMYVWCCCCVMSLFFVMICFWFRILLLSILIFVLSRFRLCRCCWSRCRVVMFLFSCLCWLKVWMWCVIIRFVCELLMGIWYENIVLVFDFVCFCYWFGCVGVF